MIVFIFTGEGITSGTIGLSIEPPMGGGRDGGRLGTDATPHDKQTNIYRGAENEKALHEKIQELTVRVMELEEEGVELKGFLQLSYLCEINACVHI